MANERFETHIEHANGKTVIVAQGDIDLDSFSTFKKSVGDQIALGHRHILVDMANVGYMDSSGFGALVSLLKVLRPLGGSISLASCSAAITRSLHLTRLDTIIHLYPKVDTALIELGRADSIPAIA
jgi:anti-sigma B factor antagonist